MPQYKAKTPPIRTPMVGEQNFPTIEWTQFFNTMHKATNLRVDTTAVVAKGTGTVSITNLAPAGMPSTISGWITFEDSAGVTRYIPYF